MNNFKVGDKVWYDGAVRTVVQVLDEKTFHEFGRFDKDYVILELDHENLMLIHYKDIEPYFTPHERLLKLGWKMWDTDGTYKTYDKYDGKYSRRTMSIKINKDQDGWYFTASYATYMDKELTTILLEYLEELENENE